MKYFSHILTYCLAALAALAMAACSGSDPSPEGPTDTTTRTVLIYMEADNSLSSNSAYDVDEMVEGMADASIDTDRHNLLLFLDNRSVSSTLYHFVKDKAGNVTKEVLQEYGSDFHPTDAENIKTVMKKAFDGYPADSYGLVFWSHGEGWVTRTLSMKNATTKWMLQEKGTTTRVTSIPDLVDAVYSSMPQKLDYIYFDACLMMTAEVAYAFRNCCDYVIACPTETPGPGGPYNLLLPVMFAKDFEPADIASTYYQHYYDTYNGGKNNTDQHWTAGASIGIVDTGHMAELAAATQTALASVTTSYTPSQIRRKVFDYDRRDIGEGHIGYYDLVQMMKFLLDEDAFSTWYQAFLSAYNKWYTTPMNYSSLEGMFDMEGTYGMAAYIPQTDAITSGYDLDYQTTEWYTAAGLDLFGW